MKKIALFIPSVALAAVSLADSYGPFEYNTINNAIMIIDFDDQVTEAEIPAEITGLPVTTIGDRAFEDCTNLGSINIPDTVTEINSNFTSCTSLTAINVGAGNPSFSSIGGVLFNKDGTVLHKVPSGLMGEYQVPEGVSTISGLTSSIEYAFAGCGKLTAITIPSSLTSFKNQSGSRNYWFGAPFSGCTSLTSIEVDVANPNYASVGGVLFSKDLATLIKLPPGLTGSYVIPETVSLLGGEFRGLALESGLTSITIGSGLIYGLSSLDFSLCEALTWIDVSEANPDFVSVDGVVFTKDLASLTAFPKGRPGSYAIPDGTTTIRGVFLHSNLTAVTIPDSVTSIGSSTFESCRNLTDVTIGKGVVRIESDAFANCTRLTNVFLPDNVTSIEDGAFRFCTDLADISIGNGVATIGNYAFFNCTAITSMRLPDSVTSLGYHVFDGCISLEELTLGEGLVTIGYNTFANCISLTELTIPPSMKTMDGGAFNFCSNLRNVYFLGEPPTSGINQFVDTPADLFVYYVQGTPGWEESFSGIPTAPFLPSWGSFMPTPDPDGIYVDTGDWLGWLDITNRPWVWCDSADEWLYMLEIVPAAKSGWVFFPELSGEALGQGIYIMEETNFGWSFFLKKWLYLDPGVLGSGGSWVYLL